MSKNPERVLPADVHAQHTSVHVWLTGPDERRTAELSVITYVITYVIIYGALGSEIISSLLHSRHGKTSFCGINYPIISPLLRFRPLGFHQRLKSRLAAS